MPFKIVKKAAYQALIQRKDYLEDRVLLADTVIDKFEELQAENKKLREEGVRLVKWCQREFGDTLPITFEDAARYYEEWEATFEKTIGDE